MSHEKIQAEVEELQAQIKALCETMRPYEERLRVLRVACEQLKHVPKVLLKSAWHLRLECRACGTVLTDATGHGQWDQLTDEAIIARWGETGIVAVF